MGNYLRLKNQSGVSIIAAIFIIVILAFMGMVFLTLFTSTSVTSINELQSTQALYVAEGGLERAVYQYKNDGTACASLINNNIPLGSGNFTTTGTLYNPSPSTTLSGAIVAADTIIPAVSTAGYAPNGRIRIDSEDINYSSIVGNSFTGAQRGAAGTTAAAHAFGAAVSQSQCTINSTGVVGNAQRAAERAIQQNYDAMVIYAKANGDGTPYYRRWNGTSWGAEQTATSIGAGRTIYYLVLKFARTRNEAVLGTLDSTGDIRVQVWNGSTQTWSATTLMGNTTAGNSIYRGFDIEYETNGDRAIVVYNNNVANQASYRIWNGTAWSAAANIALATIGVPYWIEAAPNPLSTSNEIALIALGSNTDVYGLRWTGTIWDSMGFAATWDASAATATRKDIDVAYEQQSGRAMFIWGSSTVRRQRYRIWNGAVLSGISDMDIGLMGSNANPGLANWIRLAPDPFSNSIMYSVQDDRRDLNTRFWNGAVWDTEASHPEHDSGTEDASRNSDIVFETAAVNSGKAWLLWGNGSSVSRRQWTGVAWGAITTTGDDMSMIQLMAHPASGAVFAEIYESSASATDDIWEMHLTGGGAIWSAKFTDWGGPTVSTGLITVAYPERVFIAPERYSPTVGWREVFQ